MKKILLVAIASFALTGISFAGSFGVGASGSFVKVSADGTETTGAGTNGAANTNSKSVDEIGGIASIFLDYEFDSGIVFGISHVPVAADVSSKVHTRAESSEGVSGTDSTGAVSRKADAEVENLNTVYLEYPVGPMFVKAGYSQIDVNTKENAITSSGTYGNDTLDGYMVGVGLNADIGSFFTKTAVEYTDFESLALSSSTNNKITAELDLFEIKLSVGKRF